MRFRGSFVLFLALVAFIFLLPGCKAAAPIGTATVVLRLDPIVVRRIQMNEEPTLVKVALAAPNATTRQAQTSFSGGVLNAARLEGVSKGENRVVSLVLCGLDGNPLPNSTLRAVFDLTGDATVVVNWQTTPAGSIVQRLLDQRSAANPTLKKTIDDLVSTLDAEELQRQIERIKSQANLPHYALIDPVPLADAILRDRSLASLPSMCPTIQPGTLKLTLHGLPAGVGATVRISDPLSPLQSDLRNGTYFIGPIWPSSIASNIKVIVPGFDFFEKTLVFSAGQTVEWDFDCNRWKGWQGVAALPNDAVREGAGSCVIQGKLVLIGGYDSTYGKEGMLTTIDRYVPDSNTWERETILKSRFDGTDASSPSGRKCFSMAYDGSTTAYNGYTYIFGGVDRSGSVLDEVKELSAWAWQNDMFLSSLPHPRAYGGAAVIGHLAYLVGGIGSNKLPLDAVDCFDMSKTVDQACALNAPMPNPRADLGVCVLGGKIYAVGGATGETLDEPSGKVHRFDPADNTWTALPDLPTPRYGLQAVAMGGKIYAIGGVALNPYNPAIRVRTRTVEIYDPQLNTWIAGPPLLTARAHFAAQVIPKVFDENGVDVPRDVIYVAAGENGLPVNTTETYIAGFEGMP